jgi:hypothetical protein
MARSRPYQAVLISPNVDRFPNPLVQTKAGDLVTSHDGTGPCVVRTGPSRVLEIIHPHSSIYFLAHTMVIVAIAGGTGGVGRTVLDAIAESGEHNAIVLSRTVSSPNAVVFVSTLSNSHYPGSGRHRNQRVQTFCLRLRQRRPDQACSSREQG